jgi:hypothetical protein
MATKTAYVVFILPIVLSLTLGSIVLADVLGEPGRKLNMWPGESTPHISNNPSIKIIGFEEQYPILSPIQIKIHVSDSMFDCGDLYVTIQSLETNSKILQKGFLQQCFSESDEFLPIDDEFSETIDIPGQYEIIVEIKSKNQENSITSSEKFTIK